MVNVNEQLENWLSRDLNISENELKLFLKAYSEFIVAVNPDYYYNKTYLQTYFEDFLNVNRNLKNKKIILERIVDTIETSVYEKSDFKINIDNILVYHNEEIAINNKFNKDTAMNKKIAIQYEYTNDMDYIRFYECNIDEPDKYIKVIDFTNEFINSIKEV